MYRRRRHTLLAEEDPRSDDAVPVDVDVLFDESDVVEYTVKGGRVYTRLRVEKQKPSENEPRVKPM